MPYLFQNIKRLYNMSSKHSERIIKIAIITSALLSIIFVSKIESINAPTFHLDGAFQTASTLYRLNANQVPGRDFFPYLGIGPTYALYPTFLLMGGDLSASVFSSFFIIILSSTIAIATIWQLIWNPQNKLTSITAASLILMTILFFKYHLHIILPNWIDWSTQPGNSLRPLRNFIPYIVAIFLLLFFLKHKSIRIKYFFASIICGIISLWSNDFAIPTGILFMFFLILYSKKKHSIRIKHLLVFFTITMLSVAFFLLIATKGYALSMIKYNLIDVARDQWWYFGPYSESSRIFSILDIVRLFSKENYLPIIILIAATYHFIKFSNKENALILWIGIVLFFGGTLASIGGHIGGYFGGFYFWGASTLIIGTLKILNDLSKRYLKPNSFTYSRLPLFTFMLFALFIIGMLGKDLRDLKNTAKNDEKRFFTPELGGYLPIQWKDYVKLAREKADKVVYEEYWGLWSAVQNKVPIFPVDSAISALGSTRELISEDLDKIDLFITTRHSFAGGWQSWSLSQNYWLYGKILNNYTPFAYSPATIIWQKNTTAEQIQDVSCNVDKQKNSISLNAPSEGFYEISVNYRVPGKERTLLLAENNISFGGDANGNISLNTSQNYAKFPIYVANKENHVVNFKLIPRKNITDFIIACSSIKITLSNSEALALPDASFYANLTDNNYDHGIGIRHAGFLLPNKTYFRDKFSIGKIVLMPNGEKRNIKWIGEDGQLLSIVVSGDILNAKEVGFPTNLKTADK